MIEQKTLRPHQCEQVIDRCKEKHEIPTTWRGNLQFNGQNCKKNLNCKKTFPGVWNYRIVFHTVSLQWTKKLVLLFEWKRTTVVNNLLGMDWSRMAREVATFVRAVQTAEPDCTLHCIAQTWFPYQIGGVLFMESTCTKGSTNSAGYVAIVGRQREKSFERDKEQAMSISWNPLHEKPRTFASLMSIPTQTCSHGQCVWPRGQLADKGIWPNVAAVWRCKNPRFPSCATVCEETTCVKTTNWKTVLLRGGNRAPTMRRSSMSRRRLTP